MSDDDEGCGQECDYWLCNVCGEPTKGRPSAELLVWNVFDEEGNAMRYAPTCEPREIDDWQELTGTVVHLDCLAAQIAATQAEMDFERKRAEQ